MSELLVKHHRMLDRLSVPAKVSKSTGFHFGKSSHEALTDTMRDATRNLNEEFEEQVCNRSEVPVQPQEEAVKDITLTDSNCQLDTQVETAEYEFPKGDVSCTLPTSNDFSEVSPDDDEDVIVHDDKILGENERTSSIYDFADREYQAQLDASSHDQLKRWNLYALCET